MHPFLIVPFTLSILLAVALIYTLIVGGRQADDGIVRPRHLLGANWTLGLTITLAVTMLFAKPLGALPKADPTVLAVHLYCLLAYAVLLLLMRFVFPGTTHRTLHIGLGCLMVPTASVMGIAGSIMVFQIVAAASS